MSKALLKLLKFSIRTIISLIGLSALVILPLFILNINTLIRSNALTQLQEQFPNAVVNLQSAEFIRGHGVRLRGLRIRFPKSAFINSETNPVKESELVLPNSKSGLYDFVTVEEMYIATKQSIKDLLMNGLSIERVQLRNADIVLYPVDKERWNYQYLHFTAAKKRAPFREVELNDVDCHIRDYRREEAIYELRDIKAKMTLKSENEYDVIGVMTGDYARSVVYSGRINLSKKQMFFETDVKQCELSDRLYNALPLEALPRDEIAHKLRELRLIKNVTGIMSSKAYFSYDSFAQQGQKLKYRIVGEVVNGRWDWSASSEPLTNIRIKYDVSEKEANIESFSANMGAGKIQMSYRQWTYEENAPKEIAFKVESIPLSNQFLSQFPQLPEKTADIWKSIQPSGLITADARIKFDGRTWTPNVKLQCQNGALLYDKFPYPLSNLTGTIELNNQTLQINLVDSSNIVLDGKFAIPSELFVKSNNAASNMDANNSPFAKITGCFQVKARNVSISDKVVNACPEKAQELIRQFDPKGTFNVDVRLDVQGNKTPLDFVIDIALINCSGRYEQFPYPLRNVNGRLYMKNHLWTFDNLTVNTTPVKMTGSGKVNLQPDQPHDFFLNLKMTDLPVDRVLSSSMPEQNARLINELGITGSVNAQVDIAMRLDVDKNPKLQIHAVPTDKDFSLRANSFPYRLEKVSGTIEYEDGRFTIKDFTGYHNQTLVCCQVNGMVIPGVGWKAKLSKVAIDRLKIDRDLIEAIPESMRKSLTSLNLNGPLHYRGEIDLNYNGKIQTPLSAQWNGEIGVQEVSIHKGIELRGICGGITTAGYMVNGDFYSEGRLAIESALWNKIQFSNITGPYQINNNQLFLGTGAPAVLQSLYPNIPNTFQKPISSGADGKQQPLTARLFGGNFSANIVTVSGEEPRFGAYMLLQNARLEQCGEVTQSERLLGKFHSSLVLSGNSDDTNSLRGKGNFQLEEADIYHLPAIVSMLKLLSVKEPSQNAFSNSEAEFVITGRRLFFSKLNFRGDAISLYGSGEMDFNKRVNLSFYTQVGKGEYAIPVVHDIFRGVSQNVMRIRMEGPINQLQIRREYPIFGE
ncbi:MAG: hypothetical protein IKX40_14250 [Thermoguttaceae bacterium]|nr:hypothetical protein [Thermoguttaceae bacterium]